MDKKEEFKKFINQHPELLKFIKNKEMTFQNFYEIYDIYGEEPSVWEKYFNSEETNGMRLKELTSLLKGVNLDNVEKYVNNAGKAIGILQELTKKTPEVLTKVDTPVTKYFGD